jgi:signal transduction histidine kinase
MFVLNTLFFIIWYVVSRLSMVVREHEMRLLDAYRQINQTQVEKDQYAVLMTHQLKSPLDAIRSKINLIKAGYCGESSQETKEVLMKIDQRAKNMAGLILDLLRLERLKQTCIDCADTATLKPVDINKTLQKCLDKLIPVTSAKNVDIRVSIENFAYHGIPDQLEILLENIISNAITYSFDGGSVEITSCTDHANDTASLTITDHGIGIESKDLPNIFNEYFYSPRAVTHNQASSGVGLSIVKKAAENNNLQIKVKSEPDQGTSFTVIFQHVQFPSNAIK